MKTFTEEFNITDEDKSYLDVTDYETFSNKELFSVIRGLTFN
mgnify:CR=1 FL=1